jgi:hypothetical protein
MQKRFPGPGILESNFEIGLEVAYPVARIVVPAFEANTEKWLILAKQIECVCELYFSAGIRASLGNGIPNGRFQKVAAENAEPRWRVVSRWFFYQAGDADRFPGWTHHGASDLDDTEAFHILGFDFPNGNNTSADFLVCANQLADDRLIARHNYIREKNDEGIVTQKWPRTGNGVGETQRFPLLNKL